MILCAKCGRQNHNGSAFCGSCGDALSVHASQAGACLVQLHGTEVQTQLLASTERSLGRNSDNDIVVTDDLVSGRHMKLFSKNSGFWVEDLGSRNGTFVNGKEVKEPYQMTNGDLVKVGQSIFRFED